MANGKSLHLDSPSATHAGTPAAVVASARAPAVPRGESPGALALGRLRRSRTAVVAMVTIAALILVAAGADVLAPA